MSKCLVVQHVAPESGFAIADALDEAGVELVTCCVFQGERVPPDLADLSGLVVMGGPMSATSDDGFPSRKAEIELMSSAIRAGLPTLGVCLGSQLLALASGASVRIGSSGSEIGWAPVELLAEREDDTLFAGLPERLMVLHWHGDTFDLPIGALRLAGNSRYANQAFRVGESAWGLQFHLEVTEEAVEGFLRAFGQDAELAPGGPDSIRQMTPEAIAALVESRDLVLGRFASLVAARVAAVDSADVA